LELLARIADTELKLFRDQLYYKLRVIWAERIVVLENHVNVAYPDFAVVFRTTIGAVADVL
jgi:hypothetical protein